MKSIRFGLAVIAVCGLLVLAGGIRVAIWVHQGEAIAAAEGIVRNQLFTLLQTSQALRELENGEQAYLTTGDAAQLERYSHARSELGNALARLDMLFADNPARAGDIAEIVRLARAREDAAERTLQARRTSAHTPPAGSAPDDGAPLQEAILAKVNGVLEQLRPGLSELDGRQGGQFRSTLVLLAGVVLVVDLLIVVALVTLSLSVQRMRDQHDERQHEAMHDALTLLPNRRYLTEWLTMVMARARRNQQPLVVLYFDLDGFKSVNDDLGHEAGDKVLQSVAIRLRHALRLSDFVARLGGDEFVAILPDAPVEAALNALIGRLEIEIAKAPIAELEDGAVCASIGTAQFPGDGDTVEALLASADRAMYDVKSRRRAERAAHHAPSRRQTAAAEPAGD